MNKIAVTLAAFFLLTFSVSAFTVPSKPTGYVNDYTNILSLETKQILERDLSLFAASTTNEIAVVIIPDLGGDTIERYATKLFELWKIGNAKNDNGILLLVSLNDRKMRIEVGYGLEGALPDILAKDIIDNKIAPSFKLQNYDAGVIEGVKAIEEATRGEYKTETKIPKKNFSFNGNFIEFLFIFFVFGIQFLSAILARSKSWWAGGVIGGISGILITYFGVLGISLLFGSILSVVLILLGLLFDYIVSSKYNSSISSGSSIPWWVGGGSGGGFGGGDSFGGFGGGDSGGGGASGDW